MKKLIIGTVIALSMCGFAEASLITIGQATYGGSNYNLIYDNDLKLTWLDYSYTPSTWGDSVLWADGLNTPGEITYSLNSGVGVNWTGDWRLPETGNPPGAGLDQVNSEMGHLHYIELGNKYNGLQNIGDFQNLISLGYWFGTEDETRISFAWAFIFDNGSQGTATKTSNAFALAVRPGTVSAVPLPGAVWLLGSGLAAVIGLRRKTKK